VRVLCGTDRPRPCATGRLHTRESLSSTLAAEPFSGQVVASFYATRLRIWLRMVLVSGP
jgi:hypothetical protein